MENKNKLILIHEKYISDSIISMMLSMKGAKFNVFSISEDSKLIPLFNNIENTDLLHFDRVLPYFDGIELMLNDKYVIKEISQESWDKLVKLLDLSQYEKVTEDNSIFYKKDGNYYIEQKLKTNNFYLNYKLR